MNKIIFLSILLFLTLMSCHAQKIEERTIPAFNKIKISGALNVVYTNSDTLDLIVKAKEKEINNVETRVENSTLIISNKGKFASPVYVYVKNNQLQSVECTGATGFKTTNNIKTDSLVFNASGASEVYAKIETKKLKCQGDGASSIVFEGTTDYLDADVSGAASLKSYNLIARDAVILTSGAASAKVYVTEKLNATAQSASDIKVKGNPKDVTAETGTAANITRIKEISKNTDSEGDTTTYNFKRGKILYINNSGSSHKTSEDDNEAGFKHWRGFSIAVNGYMNPGSGIHMPTHYRYMDLDYRRSLNFQFNLFERQIHIVKNYFKIVTGLGFDYHLYEFANKTKLNADSTFTAGVIDTTNKFSYKKDKLRATYIQVPLLLEFNTSNDPKKAFHLAFGVIGQYLLTSRTKQVLEDGKNEVTNIRKDGYNLSPFAAKAHVNIGYRGWTFFGEYSLTSLFQSGKGPELYSFTAGIRVIPFG